MAESRRAGGSGRVIECRGGDLGDEERTIIGRLADAGDRHRLTDVRCGPGGEAMPHRHRDCHKILVRHNFRAVRRQADRLHHEAGRRALRGEVAVVVEVEVTPQLLWMLSGAGLATNPVGLAGFCSAAVNPESL